MKKVKIISIITVIVLILVGAFFSCRYWVDATTYFTTNNAMVTADTIKVMPMATGEVTEWNVAEGDAVTAGQVLGTQSILTPTPSSANQASPSSVSTAEIKAPIDGTVVQSNVVVGETVALGTTAALIADSDNMYIKASIEETDINRIQVGQEVQVAIDAYPDMVFTGQVESIGETTQSAFSTMPSLNTSGTYTKVTQLVPVKIHVDGIDQYKLRLGYNATIKIKTT